MNMEEGVDMSPRIDGESLSNAWIFGLIASGTRLPEQDGRSTRRNSKAKSRTSGEFFMVPRREWEA